MHSLSEPAVSTVIGSYRGYHTPVRSFGYLVVSREVPGLDDPSRSSQNDKALVRWQVAFSIPST